MVQLGRLKRRRPRIRRKSVWWIFLGASISLVAMQYLVPAVWTFTPHGNDLIQTSQVFRYPGPNTTTRNSILIYITTHWSRQHQLFLQHCWSLAIQHLELFQHADVAVFSTATRPSQLQDMKERIPQIFQSTTNLTIYQYADESHNTQKKPKKKKMRTDDTRLAEERLKQTGAVLALREAGSHGYFDHYEWVIRVNPDVLILDDEWLLQVMMDKRGTPPPRPTTMFNASDLVASLPVASFDALSSDSNALLEPSLLYVPCTHNKLHTDFFALRPSALPHGALAQSVLGNAERSFTDVVTKHRVPAWNVPNARPAKPRQCRVLGSTVQHYHDYHFDNNDGRLSACPASFRHTRRPR